MNTATISSVELGFRSDEAAGDLARHRAELEATEAQIGAMLLDRELGKAVDAKAFARLSGERDRLRTEVADAELRLGATNARVFEARAAERLARYRADAATMERIAKQTPALEARYLSAATELVAAAKAINEARQEYRLAEVEADGYERSHDVPEPDRADRRFRAPWPPFSIPARYLTALTPYVPFRQFVAEWRRNRE